MSTRCAHVFSPDFLPPILSTERKSLLLDVGRYGISSLYVYCWVLIFICVVNRWLSARFNLLSSAVVGMTGVIAILTPGLPASTAGFALAFASTVTNDVSHFRF